MGNRRGIADISPQLRSAFLAGLRELARQRKQSLPQLIADELDKDFVGVTNVFAKFQVREARIQAEVAQVSSRDMAAELANQRLAELLADAPPAAAIVKLPQ